jgi:lysophospholipase
MALKQRPLHGTDVFVTADGTSIRYGIWRCDRPEPKGSVLVLNGRKEFLEKYHETIRDLNGKRYDVYSLDWRGQGLSQRLLADSVKGHIQDYGDYLQDLEGFFSQVVDPDARSPRILLAHSMGAHIVLRYLHDHPAAVEKAILIAPMIDIGLSPFVKWMVKMLSGVAVKTGFAACFAPGAKDRNPLKRTFEKNPLTSDPVRYRVEIQAVTAHPALLVGGMTFGWLAATFDSIRVLRQPGFAERISTPVLIIAGQLDRVVSYQAQAVLCSRMPRCRLEVIQAARHEVLMETDRIRAEAWKLIDDFLDSPC